MVKNKISILHITPHLGGGVGRVLLGYLERAKENTSFTHRVACLDYANENASDILKNINVKLSDKMSGKKKSLLKMITEADIVLMHWWNHPLLYDFLVRAKLPPCRLILWSHTSGFNPPAVFTEKILNYPDRFIFTTPVSFISKEARKLSEKQKKYLGTIWSTGGLDHVKSVKPKKHKGFNVGYIGTVDYAKIHHNFLKICSKIKIPNVKFIVCGGSNEKEIKREAEKMGMGHKFKFTGQISDIVKYLEIFDVFGYPLAPYHYGTCDQVLQESMAAGIVPVVFANRMEKYMVKDGVTGLVAKNEAEYIKAIEKLYHNKDLRNKMSENARKYALETFSIEKTVADWEKIFTGLLAKPKIGRKWNITKKIGSISAADIFIESLGDYGKNFRFHLEAKSPASKKLAEKRIKLLAKSINWQSETKSTAHHYSSFFPKDRELSKWSRLTKKS
jgi:L-malate glycosyltransferase